MSKKINIKRSNTLNPVNRKYKQKIYALCRRVQKGDKIAEKELNKELEANYLSRWAVKHWIRLRNSRGVDSNKDGLPTSRAKGRKPMKNGNAFKPYQGGIPGLGKRP